MCHPYYMIVLIFLYPLVFNLFLLCLASLFLIFSLISMPKLLNSSIALVFLPWKVSSLTPSPNTPTIDSGYKRENSVTSFSHSLNSSLCSLESFFFVIVLVTIINNEIVQSQCCVNYINGIVEIE